MEIFYTTQNKPISVSSPSDDVAHVAFESLNGIETLLTYSKIEVLQLHIYEVETKKAVSWYNDHGR